MRYDPEKHRRRSLRLPCYNYSQFGAYFVTICAYRGECIFENEPVRTEIKRSWDDLPKRFPGVELDEFVIMPNHVHFIFRLPGHDDVRAGTAPARDQGAASSVPTLAKVVRAFKSISAIAVNKQSKRSGRPVWQRNYFDRVVRNERELNAIRQYIVFNPEMWNEDCENPDRPSAGGKAYRIRDEIEAVLERSECEKNDEASALRARHASPLR